MKKWGLRILLAFLTFKLGLCAASILRFRLAPAAEMQPAHTGVVLKEQLPPPMIADEKPLPDEIMRPRAVEISPYEIKRLIDEDRRKSAERSELDLRPVWEQLNVKADSKINFALEQCNGYCDADIFTVELDGQPGKETILRLAAAATWNCHYLIFKQDSSQRGADSAWILLGYVDAFIRYSDPKHRVMTAGTQRWLAIEYVSGYGSGGYGSAAEDWYEVGADGLRKVLSYQTGLYMYLAVPSISREAKVIKVESRDGIATAVIQMSTAYEGWKEEFGDRFPLWKDRRKMTFIKGPGMPEFILDKQHSELLAEELDPYYGSDERISAEDFLKYNYRELTRIAVSGNAKQKEWLRNYLKDCNETLEHKSLQIALGERQP